MCDYRIEIKDDMQACHYESHVKYCIQLIAAAITVYRIKFGIEFHAIRSEITEDITQNAINFDDDRMR